jgi:hypothetical protein
MEMRMRAAGLNIADDLNQTQWQLLSRWASRYIWWKTPEAALQHPERIISQVMDIGDYDDVLEMLRAFGEDVPRHILQHAEAGMLSPRSWAYWHYRLGLAQPGIVPPLPQRRVS